MENYFDITMTDDQLRAVSSIGLAHVGDAVFEILVRTWLCAHGRATGKGLHQATIRLVCAESQSEKAKRILPCYHAPRLAGAWNLSLLHGGRLMSVGGLRGIAPLGG